MAPLSNSARREAQARKIAAGLCSWYGCNDKVYGDTRKCFRHLLEDRARAATKRGKDAKTWDDEHDGRKPAELRLEEPQLTAYQKRVAWMKKQKARGRDDYYEPNRWRREHPKK